MFSIKKLEEPKKRDRSRFQRHSSILIWKCYLQRQRRWRLLVAETLFAGVLFLIAVFTAVPVFLTPLQTEPEPPLASSDLLASSRNNFIGYAPNTEPYISIMLRAAELLQTNIMNAATEDDLNNILYNLSMEKPINNSVIWVVWKPKDENMWKFSIRSTERARYVSSTESTEYPNPHLRAGFLGVQTAVSQAVLEHVSPTIPMYELSLVSMPVSPLMQEYQVRKTISGILLIFTVALIPPVLDTQALVVKETLSRLKRAFRIRHVDYSSVYVAWLVYAYLTAFPICLLGAITLILIFRWIHLVYALLILLAYVSVMIMLALINAMFHSKASIACLWNIMFTLLQMFLAELLVHHKYNLTYGPLAFLLHVVLPPLGLVHAFNQFALLQTGRGATLGDKYSLLYTVGSWTFINALYFALLMMLQRTIGQERAIGGQVSWKSIIFKKVEDVNKLHHIETPTGREREKLQEVDELVAKAISFRNVSKSIMNVPVLKKITLDIYRGEFTILMSERVEEKMLNTIEDLLTGLTHADEGTINVLGKILKPGKNYMIAPNMMGYCHRCDVVIEDLTVEEHLILFAELCLWNESKQYVTEYVHMRCKSLFEECHLDQVRYEYVKHLDVYYRAQLCWAIAVLLEPRVIIIPYFIDQPRYISVIKHKIMQYKKYVTIVKMGHSSLQLEYADRVFHFDNKLLVFGGTPAYMFFKYGRDYRVRMTFQSGGSIDNENISSLLERAEQSGATVRAHLGSLLILQLPATPTAHVAALVKDLTDNANVYGMTSFSISVPDSEEVCRRAVKESRLTQHDITAIRDGSSVALKNISEPRRWKRTSTLFTNITQLRAIGWKYCSFYIHFRFYLIVTVISAVVAGVFIGLSLSTMLFHLEKNRGAEKMLHGEVLTVEALDRKTTLVLRADNSTAARSIAKGYVLSQTKAKESEIEDIMYTALTHTESLTEYLVTRAIDSPQQYVYMYAYGMDVTTDATGSLIVQALYSPMHHDQGAAARSLSRVYMALIRHYTNQLDASIEVTDDPLALDLTPWMMYASQPPLLIQFLLIVMISHITLIPSKEHGIIRHLQSHAMNFSPARYWFSLYFYDLILYWVLVGMVTLVMVIIMYLVLPKAHFQYGDLLVVPLLLVVYGLGCIPQAYLFSMGPRAALNSMTFAIVNIVFGETTVLTKLLYGSALNYALYFMRISPQFNFSFALVKIKQIFLYNSECIIFKTKKLCSAKTLHKCCEKCGVLQKCFARKSYLSQYPGIMNELISIIATGAIFMTLLMLWEYRLIQRACSYVMSLLGPPEKCDEEVESLGVKREKVDVQDKIAQMKAKRYEKIDTFGECLLVANVNKKEDGVYVVRDVNLGMDKGTVIALSGLKRHGRLDLLEVLAGYKMPSSGVLWAMSQWRLNVDPHMYCKHITLSCAQNSIPTWMTVYDGLKLLAILRGVPKRHVDEELSTYIDALELKELANTLICRISTNDRTRLHFAAAVIGAPPIIIVDECTAYQNYSVQRAMYYILYHLRKRGHSIFVSSSSVECHLPMTKQLGILLDGRIYDIDMVDNLVERYGHKGYTVVVHIKDEIDANKMFAEHFNNFAINDTSEVLVNVQVLDDLTWAVIFEKMEILQSQNPEVNSYIVTAIPIDYIYNSIITNESGLKPAADFFSCSYYRKFFSQTARKVPNESVLADLIPFEKKYDITKLNELPWSVIFNRQMENELC
ncbi:ATP-binding cassette sub-family A member 17-like [Achroia grisella]|uniref:ATP-binding cassette sub-family A member 17-like n=1 Tax=Achroia grisella TaxID=688607 RepID=UPI0027D2710B|nr:ATP-binding cassette sub-family A member 17-like [Achroia grisella]